MCTCITLVKGDMYFGRNLDLECGFGEKVVITPRNYNFSYKNLPEDSGHHAMIGMAAVMGGHPMYAEAVNEKGLGMAGLNFPKSAEYGKLKENADNIAPYEIIPWVLGKCASVKEARELLENANIIDIPFSENVPNAKLHWMIAGHDGCIVLEAVKEGLMIYDDPYGVLTNEPPFTYHLHNMSLYRNLSAKTPEESFGKVSEVYGEGLGAAGLPGDFSPASRFVKASFLAANSESEKDEAANVSQFFHILDSVAMVRGAVITENGTADITQYSCCVNADRGVYYYKTYDNSRIQAVDLFKEDLDGDDLQTFELIRGQDISFINRHNREAHQR